MRSAGRPAQDGGQWPCGLANRLRSPEVGTSAAPDNARVLGLGHWGVWLRWGEACRGRGAAGELLGCWADRRGSCLSLHPMLEAPTRRVDAGRCLQAGRGMDASQPVVVHFKEPGALKGREIFWKP